MRRLCVFLVMAVGLGACSLDYRPAQVDSERLESVPETVLVEAQLVIVRSESRRFQVRAARVEHYPERKQQTFDRFEFRESDAEGRPLSIGSADRAVYYTDSDDVEMSGTIRFYSEQQEAGIYADWLYWDDGERLLSGAPDGFVRVERDGGSTISGYGFRADMRSSTVEFAEQVTGTLVTDDAPGNGLVDEEAPDGR